VLAISDVVYSSTIVRTPVYPRSTKSSDSFKLFRVNLSGIQYKVPIHRPFPARLNMDALLATTAGASRDARVKRTEYKNSNVPFCPPVCWLNQASG
jgi:hypothetical protein